MGDIIKTNADISLDIEQISKQISEQIDSIGIHSFLMSIISKESDEFKLKLIEKIVEVFIDEAIVDNNNKKRKTLTIIAEQLEGIVGLQ